MIHNATTDEEGIDMELDQQLAMAMHHESNNSNQNQEMDLPDGGGNWDQSSIDGKAGDHSNITGS